MRRYANWKVLAASVTLLTAGSASGDYTAKYYAWENPTDECPDGDPRSWWGDMLDAWYEKLASKRNWSKGGYLVDNNINFDRFCDTDTGISGCSDSSNGIDEADAVMVGIHGVDNGRWEGTLRSNGSSDYSCWANSNDSVRAGDGDAEFLHLASCNSLNDHNVPNAYEMMYDPDDSPASGKYLHILTGFHGLMPISEGRVDDYEQVAKDGYYGIQEGWMDNLYDASVIYRDDPDNEYEACPVAVSIASTASGCEDRLLNNSYKKPGDDPSGVDWYCYVAEEGCDPDGEGPFTEPE